MITHGSLFGGIGGFDLGFEWAGIKTIWQVEIDKWCKEEVLEVRYPNAKRYEDIREVGKHNLEQVDIISGGFPCQDISIAGKGGGLDGKRSGLWSEMHRVISEIRPKFALIENVERLVSIRKGQDFRRILCDLAEIGYDAEWQIISAADVGAWHLRKRIWIVAYPRNGTDKTNKRSEKKENRVQKENRPSRFSRLPRRTGNDEKILANTDTRFSNEQEEEIQAGRNTTNGGGENVSNSNSKRLQGFRRKDESLQNRTTEHTTRDSCQKGVKRYWQFEPNVGRVADGIPNRVDRLKGLGNSIVPQIAYLFGLRLKELIENE